MIARILKIALVLVLLQSFNLSESIIGKAIPGFSLRDVSGKNVSLKDYPNAKGFIVVFTCNHCPFAKLYTKRLNDLNTKYRVLNVPLLAINPMDTMVYADECLGKMQERAKADGFNFPYLSDGSQLVTQNFSALRTPQAFVIWKENNQWIIKYSGAIDDNGSEPDSVKNNYLSNAVDELLAGKQVANTETRSVGCYIHYRVYQ
jgi:peroxiredoxin